jgi:hypothetical protein
MPIVPSYDNFQASPNGQPNVHFNTPEMPDYAGQQAKQLGQGLSAAGGVRGKYAMEAADEVNQVRTNDALNQLVKARTDLQLEAMQLTGRAALERPDGKSLPDEYTERLDKMGREIAAGLGNDNQRKAFTQQAGQLSGQFRGTMGSHMLQQHKQFKADTQNATVEEAQRQAGLLFGDAAVLGQSASAIRAVVEQIKTDNGWDVIKDKALIDSATVHAMSPMHAAVLKGMIDGNQLDKARQYYNDNSAELNTQARVQAHDALNVGDFEKRSQDTAGALVLKYGTDIAGALTEARATLSGKDEDEVVTRLKGLDRERVALRERAQADAADNAWRTYATTGSLSKIGATVLSSMDGKALESLRKTARADAEAGSGGRKTNIAKWLEFTNLGANQMAAMTPQDLLTKYGPYLSDQSLKEADSMMRGVKGLNGRGKPNEEGLQLITTTDLIKRTALELGVLPPKGQPTPEQEARFLGFTGDVQVKVDAWELAHKKKASPEVLSNILNDAKMDKVRVKSDWWGSGEDQPLIGVKPDKLGKAYVVVGEGGSVQQIALSSIPEAYRSSAIARRQAHGLPVTEKSIAQMWVADKRPKQ